MKLVYTYVCGDILHIGHVVYLMNGKALGDKLIVGVLTDEAIMEKKPKPIIGLEKRMELIRNIKAVDAVVPQDEYSPLKNVLMIQPDVLIESESHLEYDYVDELRRQFKGRIVFIPYYKGVSSTQIKMEMKDKWKKEEGVH